MPKRKTMLAAILLCAFAAQASASDTLSGAEIRQAIAGSTLLVTVLGGDEYTEYFAPDGTVTMKGDDGVYDGTWVVVDDTICIELTFPSNDGCWRVALNGHAITLIGMDGDIDYEKTIVARDGEAAEP